jgi:hypothetical protein
MCCCREEEEEEEEPPPLPSESLQNSNSRIRISLRTWKPEMLLVLPSLYYRSLSESGSLSFTFSVISGGFALFPLLR